MVHAPVRNKYKKARMSVKTLFSLISHDPNKTLYLDNENLKQLKSQYKKTPFLVKMLFNLISHNPSKTLYQNINEN